jgi:hypothetical protein
MNVISFITGVFDKIRMGLGMLLPVFADATDFKNWNPWLRRLVHAILLGLVLYGLYWLQNSSGLPLNVWLMRNAPPVLKPYYLCLLFLLLYALCWVAYGLIRLLAVEEEASEFPDIERAWRTAVAELAKVGIPLNDPEAAPPVFLVVGRPAGGMDALFKASGWKFEYRLPTEKGARVIVYACYDPYAVFVTAPDASGWAYLSAALDGDPSFAPAPGSPEEADPTKTISFGSIGGGGLKDFGLTEAEEYELKMLLDVQRKRELTEAERERLSVLAEKGDKKSSVILTAGRIASAIRMDIVRRGERELRFLAKLVKRDRWPLCPVNGVMVLVPWSAATADEIAAQAARVLADDLRTVRSTFQLHYPTVGIVCDLETARGFPEFRSAFPAKLLLGRLGQRVPLVPAVGDDDVPKPSVLIGRGTQWIAQAILPVWILKALRLNDQLDQRATPSGGHGHNRNLYLLMREVYLRFPRIATILANGVPAGGQAASDADPLEGLSLFGGCYLAGTGGKSSQQAFVTGVFHRLVDDQAAVAWSEKAYADDRRFNQMAMIGYVVIVVIAAVLIIGVATALR